MCIDIVSSIQTTELIYYWPKNCVFEVGLMSVFSCGVEKSAGVIVSMPIAAFQLICRQYYNLVYLHGHTAIFCVLPISLQN